MPRAMIDQNDSVFVAGHRGMVGSALLRCLRSRGYGRLITRTRDELDLLDQHAVHAFLAEQRPRCVFIAAARVGGIQANNELRADFLNGLRDEGHTPREDVVYGCAGPAIDTVGRLYSAVLDPCGDLEIEEGIMDLLAAARVGWPDTCERGRSRYQAIYSFLSENLHDPSAAMHLGVLSVAAEKDEDGVALRAEIDRLSRTRRLKAADIGH